MHPFNSNKTAIYRRNKDPNGSVPGAHLRGPRSLATLEPRAVGVDCQIKELCQSCEYVNTPYRAGLAAKHARGLDQLATAGVLEQARVLPPNASPHILNYRSVAKLAVRPAAPRSLEARNGHRFAIGLFEPGSHAVVDLTACPVHVPAINRFLQDLRGFLNDSFLAPFNEASGDGDLRYLTVRAAHLTEELLVTFVVARPCKAELRQIAGKLRTLGHKIASVYMNINSGKGNAIFGPETVPVCGALWLRERLCDFDFAIGPTSFFQINPWQAEILYRRIEQIVATETREAQARDVAWDLYCGAGQIALVLGRAGYQVLGIEENLEAIAAAEANALKNRAERSLRFISGRAEDLTEAIPLGLQSPKLVVANPSRRGIAPSMRKTLGNLAKDASGRRFIYVSCDVTTLARDLKDLTASGWKLRQVESFDMFPQTDKLEWLAVLTT